MSGGISIQPHRLYSPRSQPLAGAGVALGQRRYIAYTVVRNGCSGGNLPPSGRKAGTVVRLYPHCPTGPAPRRGWMALGQRRYSGCTMYRVIPFNPTGYMSNVAGGRLPPLRQCTTFFPLFETINLH